VVHGGGPDLDSDLAGSGLRRWHVFDAHDLGPAVFVEYRGSHCAHPVTVLVRPSHRAFDT
jgi:hypothetical protein